LLYRPDGISNEHRDQGTKGPGLPAKNYLAAAETVILEKGVTHLTLDAVAALAGISKGGLLYHYASKEALVVALVEKLVLSIEVDLQRAYEAEPEGPWPDDPGHDRGKRLPDRRRSSARREQVGVALLAAAGSNPELLEPMRKVFQEWMADLREDGLPPGIPLLIAAALDGLTFWNLFGLYAPPAADLQQLRGILEKLASSQNEDFPPSLPSRCLGACRDPG